MPFLVPVLVSLVVGGAAFAAVRIVAVRWPAYRPYAPRAGGLGAVMAALLAFIATDDASPAANEACFVGLDRSGSNVDPAVFDRNLDAIRTFLLEECLTARGGRAGVINARSVGEVVSPVSLDLGPEPGKNAQKAEEAATAALDDSIMPAIRDMAGAATTHDPGTDIIGFLDTIDDGARDAHRRILLTTDAVHQTSELDLVRVPLGDEDIERLIEDLRRSGQVPSLSDTEVWIRGANLGDRSSRLTPERIAGIEAFWRAFFRAADAVLVSYEP